MSQTSAREVAISIIVVNWNTCAITRDCLNSVKRQVTRPDYEIIVVDNASTDGSVDMIRAEFPDVTLLANPANLGFGRANNQAMRIARGEFFLLLNSDTLVQPGTVETLFDFVSADPGLGIAGCKLLFADGRLQHSCSRFPSLRTAVLEDLALCKLLSRERQGEILLGAFWPHDRARDVDAVYGAAMMVRREVFEATHGFDERIFMYGEDIEWCMRARDRGWRVAFTPDAQLVHLDHKSAEQKYGDDRIDLCHQTAYEVYRRRFGTVSTGALVLLRTAGALIRATYFGVRAALGRTPDDYYRNQSSYYSRTLRYHLRVLGGRGLAAR
jgi:GT2 family glycosyltransferase